MSTSTPSTNPRDLLSYPPLLLFKPVYLDHRRDPEPPPPPPPYPGTQSSTPPAKPTRPLAASPTPARVYSQRHCPICDVPIASAHGADYIGHTPCLHRGPCPSKRCIRAYYGRGSGAWATPYYDPAAGDNHDSASGSNGKRRRQPPLYCQAAGCGARISGWTYVRAVMAPGGGAVMPVAVVDPGLERRMQRARRERDEEERRAREKADRERERQGEGGQRGRRERVRRCWRRVREGSVHGLVWNCVFVGVVCCTGGLS